jgi:hypothetical protein
MKNISRTRNTKNDQNNSAFVLEKLVKHSRWIVWQKIEKLKFCIFEKQFLPFFKNAFASARKNFFFKICKVEVISFHMHLQVSKNI